MVVRMVRLGVVALIVVLGIANASAQEPTAERRVASAQGRNGEFFSGLLACSGGKYFFRWNRNDAICGFMGSSSGFGICHKMSQSCQVGWVEHCDQLRDKAIGFNKFGPRKI